MTWDRSEEAKEDFDKHFVITCRKCGGSNILMHVTEGVDWGGETGYDCGSISIYCSECPDNNWGLAI